MMQHLSVVARAGNSRMYSTKTAFHVNSAWNRPLRCSFVSSKSRDQKRCLFQGFLSSRPAPFGYAPQHPNDNSLMTSSRLSLSSKSGDSGKKNPSPPSKKKRFTNKKWKINPNAGQANADALAKAFADLAAKDGFDSSTSFLASASKLENDDSDDLEEEMWLDEDEAAQLDRLVRSDDDDEEYDGGDDDDYDDMEVEFDSDDEEIRAKMKEGEDDDDDEDEDLRFEADNDVDDDIYMSMNDYDDDDMDARIAAARRDRDAGRVSVPKELEGYASEISPKVMKDLGFRREANPFGNDETPRQEQFTLITKAMTCSACGSDFQSTNERKPGYLPPEKYEIQVKLSKIEDLQKLQDKAESADWSPEDEVEWLIQQSSGGKNDNITDSENIADLDIHAVAEEMGLDLLELAKKNVICKRCHGLQNFGKVDESLRPGWTEEPLLSQEAFRDMLKPIRDKTAVIVALVDLFDFAGSVLPELDAIAGENPVILAANKADLLPSQMGQVRAESWVRRELEHLGVKSIANIGGAVRLVSCKTGFGISALLEKVKSLANENDCDVYVVGAANAGKSTLINYILERNARRSYPWKKDKVRAGNANAIKGALTTSPLPGTTLKFIKIDLGKGKSLYDTPGLLVPGSLTQLLTPEELKIAMPRSQVEPVTFRIEAGKCVLIGALAKVELVGDCKPFLFTFFVANGIKLHPTDSSRADKVIAEHVGEMLVPPLPPGPERLAQIGEFTSHVIDIEGTGWKEAAADISLRGLGWVAVTGAGTAKVKITVPKALGISVRPPLMPYDIWEVAAKYTGAKAVRKSAKSKSGKRRKGVGRN